MTDDISKVDRALSCGCVVCICEDDERCHGCGAKCCERGPHGIESAATPTEVELPELPEPVSSVSLAAWGPKPDYYTADQMREYAATLARQLAVVSANRLTMVQDYCDMRDRAEQAESQLAEATRRLGEVEEVLRQIDAYHGPIRTPIHTITKLRGMARAALNKEPAK